jgi:hypothetical protein
MHAGNMDMLQQENFRSGSEKMRPALRQQAPENVLLS